MNSTSILRKCEMVDAELELERICKRLGIKLKDISETVKKSVMQKLMDDKRKET